MKYVSFNCRYYKHSQRNEISHVDRTHKIVESSNPKYKHNNFGDVNLLNKYNEVYKKVENYKERKIQKNANTFIDGVLAFNRDQINDLKETLGKEKFEDLMDSKIREYIEKLKSNFGFEPVGYYFHADEGHYENGVWLENYHAQIIMFNFDFKSGKSPLREMSRRGGDSPFSLMQDLAGSVFEPLGFSRGESKDVTKKEHLEKDEFIAKKQAENIAKINQLNKDIIEYKNKLQKVESEVRIEIESYREILRDTKSLIEISANQDQKMKVLAETFAYAESIFWKNQGVISFIKNIYNQIPRKAQKKVEKSVDLLRVESGAEPVFTQLKRNLSVGDKIKSLSDLSKKIDEKIVDIDLKKPKIKPNI